MTNAEREAIRQARNEAVRAALGPIARPGHPSRFQGLTPIRPPVHGREVRFPSLSYYEAMRPSKPRILEALNG